MRIPLQGLMLSAGISVEKSENVEAQNEYDSRIIDQADAKSVKMIKDAEKTIEIKQNKALSDMQSQIAELAMAAAGKTWAVKVMRNQQELPCMTSF